MIQGPPEGFLIVIVVCILVPAAYFLYEMLLDYTEKGGSAE